MNTLEKINGWHKHVESTVIKVQLKEDLGKK